MTQAQLENLCIEIISTAQGQRAQAEYHMKEAEKTLKRMHKMLERLRDDEEV